MADSYSRCLRPLFTNELIQMLQNGISVNLIAQDGQGRRRLLKDIKNTRLRNTKILLVDMNTYKENYDDFIQILVQQLNEKNKELCDLEQLIFQMEKNKDNIIIILHHFDDLLDNVQIDQKFNLAFFKQLNTLISDTSISLLCVTSQAHDQCVVFIEGKRHRISWLCLEKRRLPKLTYDEIQLDLKSRLSLSQYELSQLTWAIHNHPKPYSLLNFFATKIADKENTDIDIAQRIKIWGEQFTEQEKMFFQEHTLQLI